MLTSVRSKVDRLMCRLLGHKLVTNERLMRHTITAVYCTRCKFTAGDWTT